MLQKKFAWVRCVTEYGKEHTNSMSIEYINIWMKSGRIYSKDIHNTQFADILDCIWLPWIRISVFVGMLNLYSYSLDKIHYESHKI